jgi:hypothetical protein
MTKPPDARSMQPSAVPHHCAYHPRDETSMLPQMPRVPLKRPNNLNLEQQPQGVEKLTCALARLRSLAQQHLASCNPNAPLLQQRMCHTGICSMRSGQTGCPPSVAPRSLQVRTPDQPGVRQDVAMPTDPQRRVTQRYYCWKARTGCEPAPQVRAGSR